MAYALLQLTLDQRIERSSLEEASVVVPSVARADCARLHKELFGIVVGGLEQAEARAFQQALAQRGFPTELVEESELPRLPEPRRIFHLQLGPAGLASEDVYGGTELVPWPDLVFAAGGFLTAQRWRPQRVMEWQIGLGPGGSMVRQLGFGTEQRLQKVPEFRLDFLFGGGRRRQLVLREQTVARINGQPVQLRDRETLEGVLRLLQALPATRTNTGIRRVGAAELFSYPSEQAFEEEIVWSLYRLGRADRAS